MSQVHKAIETLEAAFYDVKDRYKVTITDHNGSRPGIVSRAEHLEALIEMALNELHEYVEEQSI